MSLKTLPYYLLVFLCSVPVKADEVRIYTWEEYISSQVISEFEEKTGHKVSQIYFENEQLRDEVVMTERALAYDLFIIDAYSLNAYSSSEVARKIDMEVISNRKHIGEEALSNCGNWGIPYTWGTIGVGYRENRIEDPITSWSQVFSLSKAGKNVVIPSDDIDTIAVALMSLGFHPMSNDENELKQAYALLAEQKNRSIEFRTPVGYAIEWKKRSSMDVAVMYSGETYTLSEVTGQKDWNYIVPQEGTLIWYDCFAAPAGKPLSKAAISFLNFINEPEIAAKNAENLWLATTNRSALNYVSKKYLADKELFPDADVLNRSYYYSGLNTDSLRIRARIMSILNK